MTIARRLMDIREQMAEQLSADLRRMAAENDKLERNYADEVHRKRWCRVDVTVVVCRTLHLGPFRDELRSSASRLIFFFLPT